MNRFRDIPFSENQLEDMRTIRNLVKEVDWEVGLRAWQEIFTFDHPFLYKPEVIPGDLGEPQIVSRPPGAKKQKLDQEKRGKSPPVPTVGEENKEKTLTSDTNTCLLNTNESVSNMSEKCDKNIASHAPHDTGASNIADSEDQSKLSCTKKAASQTVSEKTTCEVVSERPARVRLTTHDPTKLTFRVTCNRTGSNHSFQSMCAAANFGGAIHQYFQWNIDMKKFDIEVILNIDRSEVSVCLGLTRESLHRRHIAHFGPTTLRPTIAFNMLRMCKIRPGEVICDPMCGGGTIPIEAAVNWRTSAHICGEIHHLGANRTMDNIVELNRKRLAKGKPPALVDTIQWDACSMPLRDSSVDVFISDLPFGKRIGHKVDNWKLYPAALLEMARVCRPETGRACFLTHDKRCMIKTIHGLKKFWRQVRSVGVNIGGLSAIVFLIYRTGKTVSPEDAIPTADVLRKLPVDQPPEVEAPEGADIREEGDV